MSMAASTPAAGIEAIRETDGRRSSFKENVKALCEYQVTRQGTVPGAASTTPEQKPP